MQNISKYRPWSELPLTDSRVNNYTNTSKEKGDRDEENVLEVGQKVYHLITEEWNELLVLNPNIFTCLQDI